MIDYSEELRKIEAYKPGEMSNFWKPEPGQYRVKALSELVEASPFVDDQGKESPQAELQLQLLESSKSITWTLPVGKTVASAYGQLCRLGKEKGKLEGLEFMIIVINDGKKNSYTIVTV